MVMCSHTLHFLVGVHTCTQMCPGLLCSPSSRKLISAGSDPGSCSCPPSSPIICHHVGRCSLTCGLQMAILCSIASTGATVPCAEQLSRFATWHFHSNESHSPESPCQRECIHKRFLCTSAQTRFSSQSAAAHSWGINVRRCKEGQQITLDGRWGRYLHWIIL